MSANYVPFHRALTRGEKRSMPRATRFIFVELLFEARELSGEIRLRTDVGYAEAVHDLIGGDFDEIAEAIPFLSRPDMDGKPMIWFEPGRAVIPSWADRMPQPSTQRVQNYRARSSGRVPAAAQAAHAPTSGTHETLHETCETVSSVSLETAPCFTKQDETGETFRVTKGKEIKGKEREGEGERASAPAHALSEISVIRQKTAPGPTEPALTPRQAKVAEEFLRGLETGRDVFGPDADLRSIAAREAMKIEIEKTADGLAYDIGLQCAASCGELKAQNPGHTTAFLLSKVATKVNYKLGDIRLGKWKPAEPRRGYGPTAPSEADRKRLSVEDDAECAKTIRETLAARQKPPPVYADPRQIGNLLTGMSGLKKVGR